MNQKTTTPNQSLHNLFTSRVRIKLLTIFLPHPTEMYYVRQVTRMAGEEVNAVRRELERLKEIGFLIAEERANRLYYRVRKDFPFYYELLRMVGKISGLGQAIIEQANQLGHIKFAMLSTRFVENAPSEADRIDALFVGQVEIESLQKMIRAHEEKLGREINYTVMTADELALRKTRGDAFIRSVLSQPQVVLIGDEEELNG